MNLTGQPIYQRDRPARSRKLRKAARGQTCTLRIPGICTNESSHVVACHIRMPGICGTAQKPTDLAMIDACANCHAVLDSRDRWADAQIGWDDVLRALIVTLERREREGEIIINE